MRDLLNDKRIRQLVSQVDALPSLPELYLALEEELQSAKCSIETVATIISQDVGMTAKILKLVNSAFFGIQQNIGEVKQAVMFLGMDTMKTLVLSIKVFEKMEVSCCPGFDLKNLSQHSLTTGALARKIMMRENADTRMIEDTFTAAVLHDLGKLLLVSSFYDSYVESLRVAQTQYISLHAAELQTLGTTHAEVGAYLLGLWGLQTPIVEAVAFHHDPLASQNTELSPLTGVYVANTLLSVGTDADFQEEIEQLLCIDYLDKLGLRDRVADWQQLIEVPV